MRAGVQRPGGQRARRRFYRAAVFLALLPAALTVWWPLWFLAAGAITAPDELAAALGPALGGAGGMARWQLLPSLPTAENLITLFLDTPQFFVMFWNSTGQVFLQLAGQLLVGAPAAWALARLRFRGRGAVRAVYLLLMLMPFQVLMVPEYLVLGGLGLLNTPWAIVLPGVFATLPVFLMECGFAAVPRALLEAAALDGAGQPAVFLRIGLPLGAPGVVAALTLSFLEGWNAIEPAMTFLKEQRLWPLALYFSTGDTASLGVSMAASLMLLLPAVLVFRCGQTDLEQGLGELGSAALKG